jgi:hypothetical protein
MSILAIAKPTVTPALSRGARPLAKPRAPAVCRAMAAQERLDSAEKTRPAGKVAAAVTGALVALPALAEEAAAATSGEISPFAGVVDITVLGVVGLLAVQGNKKAEAAKAAGGKKGGKKKK